MHLGIWWWVIGLGALAALVGVGVLAIAAYSAHVVVRPRRNWQPPSWQPPEKALESVQFSNSAGQRLAGWFHAPQPGRPVVLICHGFGTNRREGHDTVGWLTAAGDGVLLFDFQAHGESEGRTTTVGLREVDDALAAVRWLQQRQGAETPILGLGFSMGASVLIMAAARCPAIQAVVLDSPFATLERAVARSFRVFFRLPPRVFSRPTLWFAERFTGGRLGDVQPITAMAHIAPRPVLIIQCGDDGIVDPEDSLLLYEAAGEPKSLWRLPTGGHVEARWLEPETYRQRVLAFLEQALQHTTTTPTTPVPALDVVVQQREA